MFCSKCGTQNDETAHQCIQCAAILNPDPAPQHAPEETPPPPGAVPNYLAQSILATLFCCLPFGIPAIVYSASVNGKMAEGDYAGAGEASRQARTWCWVSFGVGAGVWALLGIPMLAAIALPLYLSAVSDSQVKTARANMQTIANAEQAYRTRWQAYTSSFEALSADLGTANGPSGPGSRTYTITIGAGNCTDNCPGGVCNSLGAAPSTSFSVSDNIESDGVYCPGISPD
jgi:type II secretory pathway pseudopilin PulG